MKERRVDEYMQNFDMYSMRYLDRLMQTSTTISGETSDGFFSNIWIPTRKYNPQTGQLDENYTYYNCGMSSNELADLYWTQYSGNFLIGNSASINIDYAYLETRCSAIFKKNLGKYRHLMELEGLIWNPLWNVDGTEIHQLLEKHANESTVEAGSASSANGRNMQDERQVTSYDSPDYKNEYKETHKGLDSSTGPSASATYGSDTLTSTGGAVSNVETSSSEARASRSLKSHDSFTYSVKVEDTAFGTAIEDGDVLHTEKTVRQGNIGVTKTTELIEDARRTVRFCIIQEFFNDINEVILVGVWDDSWETPFWQRSYPSSAGIDHIEVDKLGHIVKVAMKGDSTEITPNMVVFGNKTIQ